MFRFKSIRLSQNCYKNYLRTVSFVRRSEVTHGHPLSRVTKCVENHKISAVSIACMRFKSNGKNGEPGVYIQYEDLIQLLEAGAVRLIDVRDAKEIQETGEFPGAYNIPLQDLKKALKLSEEEFKQLYNFEKPKTSDTDVVFASLKAVKSSAALEIAHKLGFTKTRQYINGYEEWVEKQNMGKSKAAG